MSESLRVEGYVERSFQRSGQTGFPTVRQVARAIGIRQDEVEGAVDDHPTGNLQLTYYRAAVMPPLGDYFVETISEPTP